MSKSMPKTDVANSKKTISAEEVAQKAGTGTKETEISALISKLQDLSLDSFDSEQQEVLSTLRSGLVEVLKRPPEKTSRTTVGTRNPKKKAQPGTDMIPDEGEAIKKPRAKKVAEPLPEDQQCIAVWKSGTKKGEKCCRKVTEGAQYCPLHLKSTKNAEEKAAAKEKNGGKRAPKAPAASSSDEKVQRLLVKGVPCKYNDEDFLKEPISGVLFRVDDGKVTIYGEIHDSQLYALSVMQKEKYSSSKNITVSDEDLPTYVQKPAASLYKKNSDDEAETKQTKKTINVTKVSSKIKDEDEEAPAKTTKAPAKPAAVKKPPTPEPEDEDEDDETPSVSDEDTESDASHDSDAESESED